MKGRAFVFFLTLALAEGENTASIFDEKIFHPFASLGHSFVLPTHQKFEEVRTNCKYFTVPCLADNFASSKEFRIIHINARSILSDDKFEEFKLILYRSGVQWDIVCVSETWLCELSEQFRSIDGYTCFFDSRSNQSGGGVAIYVCNSKIKRTSVFPKLMKSTQSLFISVSLSNNMSFIIGQVYKPPSLDSNLFIDDLAQCLETLSAKNKSIFVCGDFNFDLFNISENNNVHHFFNTFASFGFWPMVSKATRAQGNALSLIDNIYSNNLSIVQGSGILLEDTTDHFPVFVSLKVNVVKNKESHHTLSRFDYNRIPELTDFLLHKLDNFENILDPDIASNTLINAYALGIEQFSVRYKPNRKTSALKPWVTPAILDCINRRSKLFLLKQRYPTQENIQRYTTYRNILNSVIKEAKKMYIQGQLESCKSDSKKMWEILLTHSRGMCSNKLPEYFVDIDKNKTVLSDKSIIANKFNHFFSSVGKQLQEKIQHTDNDPLEFINNANIVETNDIDLITAAELTDVIKSMKNVGGGVDGINAKIFKATYESILHKLTYFINICLRNGRFPDNLKIAVIKPVYKSGDKYCMNNYRPISILPYISKLLEKIIYERLMKHLTANDILDEHQFGFRKKLSTYMPILLLQEKITKAFENKNTVCGIYLDLKKAFDTVDHGILLSKMFLYGLRGKLFHIIKSYLTNRLQCVEYLNTKSATLEVEIGVPQGSILGPLLFILYINDFPKICSLSTCFLYADDTAIFFEAENEQQLQQAIDREIPVICHWFRTNKLSLNANKTYCQIYNHTASRINIDVCIDGTKIDFVDSVKYLGMYIDKDLKWRTYIDKICNIVSRNIGIIKKSSFFLQRKHLLLLYNAFCLPYFNYCCLIWGHSSPTLLARLEILQKKAIRVIDRQHRLAHTNPIFVKLKLLKIKDIAVQQCIVLLHNVIFKNVPTEICSLFNTVEHNPVGTRIIRHFEEPFTARLYGTRVVSWLGPRLWNRFIAPKFSEIDAVPNSKQIIKKIAKSELLSTYIEG